MKKIILILLVLLLFIYSCEDNNQREIHYSGCETDSDCLERLGNNYICQDNLCRYNYCKSLNGYETCGDGDCENIRDGYYCNCPSDEYNKRMSSYSSNNKKFHIDKCVTDISCEKASDCDYFKKDNQYLTVCSESEDKCVNTCIDDFDCKGEYAKCYNDQPNFNRCYDLKELYNEYINNLELHEDCKDSFFNPYTICGKQCEISNECSMGFVCSLDKTCLPICVENKDCENDKFSNGNICDAELSYCVSE